MQASARKGCGRATENPFIQSKTLSHHYNFQFTGWNRFMDQQSDENSRTGHLGSTGAIEPDISEDRLSTGIEGLDDILGGGLPKGHLYLVEGDPGTGKTTLALQFLLEGAAKQERGMYVTLSESKLELEQVAASHGWSTDSITIYEMVPPDEDLGPEAQYTVFHPSEVEL